MEEDGIQKTESKETALGARQGVNAEVSACAGASAKRPERGTWFTRKGKMSMEKAEKEKAKRGEKEANTVKSKDVLVNIDGPLSHLLSLFCTFGFSATC
jgi:hypothetical protein